MFSTRGDQSSTPNRLRSALVPRPSTTNQRAPTAVAVKRPSTLRTVSPSASIRRGILPFSQVATERKSDHTAALAPPTNDTARLPIANDGWVAAVLRNHLPHTLASQVQVTTTPINLDSSMTVGSSRNLPPETISRSGSTTVVTIPRLVLAMEETTTFLVPPRHEVVPNTVIRNGVLNDGFEHESRVKVVVRNAPETHKKVHEYVQAATNARAASSQQAFSRSNSTIPTLRQLDGAARDYQRATMRKRELARASEQDEFKVSLDYLIHQNRKLDRAEARRRIREGGYIDSMPSPGNSPRLPKTIVTASRDEYCYLPQALTPRKTFGKASRLGTPVRSRSSPAVPGTASVPSTPKRAASPVISHATTAKTLPFADETPGTSPYTGTTTSMALGQHTFNIPLWEQVQQAKPYPPLSRSPSATVDERTKSTSPCPTMPGVPRLVMPQNIRAQPSNGHIIPLFPQQVIQTPRTLTRRVLRDAHTQHGAVTTIDSEHGPSQLVLPRAATNSQPPGDRKVPSSSPSMPSPSVTKVHLRKSLASWGGDKEVMTILEENSERQQREKAAIAQTTDDALESRGSTSASAAPLSLPSSSSPFRLTKSASPVRSVILEERRLIFEKAGLLQPKSVSPRTERVPASNAIRQLAQKLELLGLTAESALPHHEAKRGTPTQQRPSPRSDSPDWIPSPQSESEDESKTHDSPRRPVRSGSGSPRRNVAAESVSLVNLEHSSRSTIVECEASVRDHIASSYRIDEAAHLASAAAALARTQQLKAQEAIWRHEQLMRQLQAIESKESSLRYGDEQHEDEVWKVLLDNFMVQTHIVKKVFARERETRQVIVQCEGAEHHDILQAIRLLRDVPATDLPSMYKQDASPAHAPPSSLHPPSADRTSRRLSEDFVSPDREQLGEEIQAAHDTSVVSTLHELSGILEASPQTQHKTPTASTPVAALEVADTIAIVAVQEVPTVQRFIAWLQGDNTSQARTQFANILADQQLSQATFAGYTHDIIMQEVCDDFGSYFSTDTNTTASTSLLAPRRSQPRRYPLLPLGTVDGVMECFAIQGASVGDTHPSLTFDRDGAPAAADAKEIIDHVVLASLKAFVATQVDEALTELTGLHAVSTSRSSSPSASPSKADHKSPRRRRSV